MMGTSAVRLDGILSKEFLSTTRVLKGDTLPPFLFIVVLNFVCSAEGSNNNRLTDPPAELLPDLDFADDITLLDQDETDYRPLSNNIILCKESWLKC